MPTAVLAIRIVNGYVLAADGRSLNPEDLSIKSDAVQKIFPLNSSAYDLAFAILGTAEIAADASGDKFNLVAEILRISGLLNPL
jgi:20S proteasome alpha/beta subunit